jgi:glucosyl-dolichyl phosphate glucuronosyltransferase
VSAPFLSVIIATHGRAPLLIECVESVSRTARRDYEILAIDQDPNGETGELLKKKFPGRDEIRYFIVPNAGAARARNFGLEQARGEIVAFIDDDAIAADGWLDTIRDEFASNAGDVHFLAGRVEPLWTAGRPHWLPPCREFLYGLYDIGEERRLMPEHDQPITANMAGRRAMFVGLGGFDERLGFNHFRRNPMLAGEDAMMGQRAREAGFPIHYQPAMRVQHRMPAVKSRRDYFLKRHFWEGFTVIEMMNLNGSLGDKLPYIRWHASEIAHACARFALPDYQRFFQLPRPMIRMLALSRAAYSAGVIYRLITLKRAAS